MFAAKTSDDSLFDICSKHFIFIPIDNSYILSKEDTLLIEAQGDS